MTEQRLSDARLREIMEAHEQRWKFVRGFTSSICIKDDESYPCETRRMAEELIERRRQEADWLAEALEGHRD